MRNEAIIIGIMGGASLYGLSLYNAAKRLNFRPLFPQNVNVSQGALKFDLPLVVLNDSNRKIPVSGYGFDLYVQGKFLAKVYAFDVPPIQSGENTIYGRVVVPILDLLSVVPELRSGAKTISVLFTGNVRLLEVLTIPIPDFNMSFNLPKINL